MARTEGFLRGAVGTGDFDNKPEDIIAAKRRLRDLGLYEPPPEGFGNDIDAGFDRALRTFQEQYGLRVDGYLEPDGETERNMESARTGRGFDPGPSPLQLVLRGGVGDGGDNDPEDVALVKRAFGAMGRYGYDRTRPPSPYVDPKLVEAVTALQRENDLFDSGRIDRDDETIRALRRTVAEHRRKTGPQGRRRRPRPGETEVALGPAAYPFLLAALMLARGAPHLPRAKALGALLGGGAAGQAAIELGKKQGEQYQATDPLPPTPPFPEEPRDPKDNREEFPAEGPKLPDRTETPVKSPELPNKVIYQSLEDDEFWQQITILRRAGSPPIRKYNDVLGKNAEQYGKEEDIPVEVEGGGFDSEEQYRRETWLAPHESIQVSGKPTANGSYLDITIRHVRNRRRLLLNTHDPLSDGVSPTARERRQAEKVMINKETGDIFYSFEKPPKGEDIDEYVKRHEPMLRQLLRMLDEDPPQQN